MALCLMRVDSFATTSIQAVALPAVGTDAASGISTGNTFTHAFNLGSSAALPSTPSLVIHPSAVFEVSPLASYALTAAHPVTSKLDGTGIGTCGCIQATALEITAANVVFDIAAPLDDPVYILATCTSKTSPAFQHRSNMLVWPALNITTPTAAAGTLGESSGGPQTVTIRIPKTLAAPGGKLFGRLHVTKIP